MATQIDKTPQLDMYKVPIAQYIKENHVLVLLTHKLNWDKLERELSVYYFADNGRPCIPIRKIAGIVILKRMFNESDENSWTDG